MKRLIYLVVILISLSVTKGYSQVVNSPYKHEIGVALGITPLSQSLVLDRISHNYHSYEDSWRQRQNGSYVIYGNRSISQWYDDSNVYAGDWHTTSSAQLHYTYSVKKWFHLTGVLSYCGAYQHNYLKTSNNRHSTNRMHLTSFIPNVKFVWLNTPLVKMYGSVGLGLVFESIKKTNTKEFDIYPAVNFNYFGLSVGKKVYGFTELSLGNLGLIAFGVGIKLY